MAAFISESPVLHNLSLSASDKYQIIDPGTLGGTFVYAFAINEHGQVVADSETAKGEFHAWLWEHEVMTDLGTLGGTISSTSQFGGPKKVINNRGQIVGGSDTATGEFRPVIWTKPGKH